MRARWLARAGGADLIVVFGGWALGSAPFAGLTGAGDVLFVEDYRDLECPLPDLADYDRVDLVAYSFGVASAAHWLSYSGLCPNRLIAVAGTLCPADAHKGIAPDLIRATADTLSLASFAKFCRRAGLTGDPPSVDIDAVRVELRAVIDRGPAPDRPFDRIWIPQRDRIIPTQAQHAAWAHQSDVVRAMAGPHVPFGAGQSWAGWIA